MSDEKYVSRLKKLRSRSLPSGGLTQQTLEIKHVFIARGPCLELHLNGGLNVVIFMSPNLEGLPFLTQHLFVSDSRELLICV